MVNHNDNNNSNQDDGDKNPSTITKGGGGGGGATRSWGTNVSGQSISTSGSVGSPSSRSEAAMATPASDSTFLRLNKLDIQGDDAGSQETAGNRKKKRGQRAVGGDKSGRGLRQFSMKVCEKVESKGRTTYNEVADELVAEFADPNNSLAPDQQQYDEKNIRRRVYDALNVLMAMDIISKDKKEIQWRGLPRTSMNDIEELKTERLGLRNRIEKKAAYLEELEEQTRPHATVEVEISEDMQLVHFDFNSTPFELHDDNYVLKAMKFCEKPQIEGKAQNTSTDGGESSSMANVYQPQIPHQSRSNVSGRPSTSPPLPGILKARVKHEH
ncbi:hypothetical protein BUALT_Bualt16G0113100 [Buddleja alternifolia]|uniref:Transcription factor-like protein DPB n=1 Tax=Buddleja alternifolia TaxID=168488 RepID=A0AAV6WHD5_9LAMI|nr:hypothetical protein BUALT_Bualt16G0113100 [Buddleja alternifolia]